MNMFRELRYALRALSKSPGFAVTSIVSLALGIAASTVVFGVINGINFQSLPYRDGDRLVEVGEFLDPRCAPACLDHPSTETISRWRARARSFEGLATAVLARFQMGGSDSAASVLGAEVDERFFPLVGVLPVLGRPLLPSDFQGSAEPDVVIGRRLWARQFGERRDILGASLRLNGMSYTIVGVVSSDFAFPTRAELWVPRPFDRAAPRGVLSTIARLKRGVSIEQARVELRALSRTQHVDEPDATPGRIGTALSLRATAQGVAADLWMLFGAVGAALLIACANVMSLSLVRGLARAREMAVRSALGANQWRLLLPPVSEGLLVALGGAAGGVLLALWTQGLVARLIERVYNYPIPLALNLPVLAASVVLSILIGVIIGLVPGLRMRDMDVQQTLRDAAVATTATKGARRLRVGLVVAEIAAALVLFGGAGLLAASYLRIRHYDLGYDAGVRSATLSFAGEGQSGPPVTPLAALEIVARAQVVTGGEAAIWAVSYPRAAARSPSAPFDQMMSLDVRRANLTVAAVPPVAYHVTPGFFQATSIRLIKGRSLTTSDDASAEPVAVVNVEAARLWWPGEEALGRRFRIGRAGEPGPWITVVGIAANTHLIGSGGVYGGVANPGYFPLVFRPLAQTADERSHQLGLRLARWGSSVGATLRREVQRIAPGLRVGEFATLRDVATDDERFAPVALDAQLVGGLALFGVFLALIGTYGLVADVVRRRTHEIGIRMALGASPRNILGLVLKDALRFAAAGIALGVVGMLMLGGVLRSLLFGMSPTNPVVFAVVCVMLAVVVMIASYLPARTAAKVDPMVALRYE